MEQVAASYVEAGSRVILTNTFGANRIRLARHGLADQVPAVNRAGVEISLRAARCGTKRGGEGERGRGGDPAPDRNPRISPSPPLPLSPSAFPPLVFASMGPSGLLLAMGQASEADLRDVFAEQAAAIKDAGADGIAIETMSDLSEAVLALDAARETGLPVVVCMTFDSGPKKDRTMMGVTPEQAAERLTAAGADVVGATAGTASPDWSRSAAACTRRPAGRSGSRPTPACRKSLRGR